MKTEKITPIWAWVVMGILALLTIILVILLFYFIVLYGNEILEAKDFCSLYNEQIDLSNDLIEFAKMTTEYQSSGVNLEYQEAFDCSLFNS